MSEGLDLEDILNQEYSDVFGHQSGGEEEDTNVDPGNNTANEGVTTTPQLIPLDTSFISGAGAGAGEDAPPDEYAISMAATQAGGGGRQDGGIPPEQMISKYLVDFLTPSDAMINDPLNYDDRSEIDGWGRVLDPLKRIIVMGDYLESVVDKFRASINSVDAKLAVASSASADALQPPADPLDLELLNGKVENTKRAVEEMSASLRTIADSVMEGIRKQREDDLKERRATPDKTAEKLEGINELSAIDAIKNVVDELLMREIFSLIKRQDSWMSTAERLSNDIKIRSKQVVDDVNLILQRPNEPYNTKDYIKGVVDASEVTYTDAFSWMDHRASLSFHLLPHKLNVDHFPMGQAAYTLRNMAVYALEKYVYRKATKSTSLARITEGKKPLAERFLKATPKILTESVHIYHSLDNNALTVSIPIKCKGKYLTGFVGLIGAIVTKPSSSSSSDAVSGAVKENNERGFPTSMTMSKLPFYATFPHRDAQVLDHLKNYVLILHRKGTIQRDAMDLPGAALVPPEKVIPGVVEGVAAEKDSDGESLKSDRGEPVWSFISQQNIQDSILNSVVVAGGGGEDTNDGRRLKTELDDIFTKLMGSQIRLSVLVRYEDLGATTTATADSKNHDVYRISITKNSMTGHSMNGIYYDTDIYKADDYKSFYKSLRTRDADDLSLIPNSYDDYIRREYNRRATSMYGLPDLSDVDISQLLDSLREPSQ